MLFENNRTSPNLDFSFLKKCICPKRIGSSSIILDMNDNALIKNCDTIRTSDFVSANKTCGNCCVDLHSCAAKDNQYTAAKYIELFYESENPSTLFYIKTS